MSSYKVEAHFTWAKSGNAEISGEQASGLAQRLAIHNGHAVVVPGGWLAWIFLAMMPGPAEAAHDAGEIMRKAASETGLPMAVMTDVHITRLGG